MTDPRRLREDASGLEHDLLSAGAEDAPPTRAKDRAAVALGFATGTAVTTGAATAGATTVAAKATVLGMSTATVKILGVCIASSAIAAVAVHSVASHGSATSSPVVASPPAAPLVSATRSAPSAPSAAPVVAAEPSSPEPVPAAKAPLPPMSAAAPVPLGTPAPVRVPDVAGSHPAPASSLSDELALLDLARAAYRSGDPNRTLTLLEEHDDMYPGSPLALESQVLRIDALAAAGRNAEALAAADRFLAAHPNEPMSRHVESLAERLRGRSNP